MRIEDALNAEIAKLKSKLAFIENQPLLVVKPPDAVIYENALDANREYRITIGQLRKDNQSLVEQIHIMAEFLVAEGICPFTHCIHKQPHTDEDCMFCWEHRGNGTKGDNK